MNTSLPSAATEEVICMAEQGKLAVITGGTTGIGRDICLALAAESWDLAVNDLQRDERATSLVAEIEALGRRCLFRAGDVADKRYIDDFYTEMRSWYGAAPSLLVNNAGCQTWSPLLDLQEEDWDRVINTNLKGCFLNTQAAGRLMAAAADGGAIVNIGSGCNKLAFPKLVDYTASKGGVEMFTKTAAVELGQYGIRVNCVAPGGILIERTAKESPDYTADWSAIAPLGRVGLPKDIADAVIFLAGDKSSFITGQTLWVDGGVFSKANWPYE